VTDDAAPPPPHDPADRVVVATVDGWEVRAFPEGSRMHDYSVPRMLLHLQLWHPARRVSVLTPSRLALRRWEIFPVAGWKMPIADDQILRDILATELRAPLPGRAALEALLRWFVDRPVRNALDPGPTEPRREERAGRP